MLGNSVTDYPVTWTPDTGKASYSLNRLIDNPAEIAVRDLADRLAEWSSLPVAERCARLMRWHGTIGRETEELAACVTREIGKPLQESLGADILPSLAGLEWLAKNAPKTLRDRRVRYGSMSAQPLGVIGVIGTWNYPVFLSVGSIAWALAAGNAVIWKPSELAEETARILERQTIDCGLPVRVLYGDGATGEALCRAGCSKIAFTGSVSTGRRILQALAETGTPSVMELSGNDAMIVLDDAPLELAAKSAVWGRVCNAGQSCVAPQRIYVDRSRYEEFLNLCLKEIEGLNPSVELSPMRTEAIRNRAHRLVLDAISRGARPITGRNASEEMGLFYPPTLIADCTDDMPVMAEDFFGPVLAVAPFDSDREAAARAGKSDMALAASIWTNDRMRGERIARVIHVGLVSINEVVLDAANPQIPFGGLKSSGFGKQRGVAGLQEFVVWKTVTHRRGKAMRQHLFPYQPNTPELLSAFAKYKSADTVAERIAALKTLAKVGFAIFMAEVKARRK